MIAAFIEAIQDLALPCSLTLVIPGVAASLATRANAIAVALSAFGGTTAIGWLRITDQIPSGMTAWTSAGLGLLVLIAFGALYGAATRTAQRATAGAVIGAAAASIWTPCVGEQLGVILNQGPDDPLGVLLPFIAFIAGISLVAIAVGLARVALEPPERVSKVLSVIGTSAGVGVALLLGSGRSSDVVARLVMWSLLTTARSQVTRSPVADSTNPGFCGLRRVQPGGCGEPSRGSRGIVPLDIVDYLA